MSNTISVAAVREWFASYDDEWVQSFLDEGLADLIIELEQDDFFGTEGFGKRFA